MTTPIDLAHVYRVAGNGTCPQCGRYGRLIACHNCDLTSCHGDPMITAIAADDDPCPGWAEFNGPCPGAVTRNDEPDYGGETMPHDFEPMRFLGELHVTIPEEAIHAYLVAWHYVLQRMEHQQTTVILTPDQLNDYANCRMYCAGRIDRSEVEESVREQAAFQAQELMHVDPALVVDTINDLHVKRRDD